MSLTGVSQLVKDANAGGTTVLLVEQNVRLGLSMATHGVVLEGGRVRLEAPAAELMANPEVAELYLGGASHDSKAPRPAESAHPVPGR
jgi:branched-chain amino acid transport system ATP-binding protein